MNLTRRFRRLSVRLACPSPPADSAAADPIETPIRNRMFFGEFRMAFSPDPEPASGGPVKANTTRESNQEHPRKTEPSTIDP